MGEEIGYFETYLRDVKRSSINTIAAYRRDLVKFEKYMEDNNIIKINRDEDIKVKDLKIDNGSYIVFCYDKKEFYHMIPIIDNDIYDKNSDCMDLYVISVYRKII